ncbi:hypothetical protein WN55_00972 [Dufourea novaeangliae]|uniref:Uncharacterized protein n=1 Tax=Dufourea novaeangliae TaxID=178035 RepID=A0A154PDF6_DUFNO|nr:hypothetical protein WN55_00972 [Dufourea novaeangliae]
MGGSLRLAKETQYGRKISRDLKDLCFGHWELLLLEILLEVSSWLSMVVVVKVAVIAERRWGVGVPGLLQGGGRSGVQCMYCLLGFLEVSCEIEQRMVLRVVNVLHVIRSCPGVSVY